jgi:hypothetical protein
MILDNVNVLVNFWNLLVLIEQSEFEAIFASHVFTIDSFGCEDSFQNLVISI